MATAHQAVTVVGPDVTLRPWASRDKDTLVVAFVDPEIHRFTITIPLPYTLEHAEEFVDDLSIEAWRSGGAEFAIDLGDGRAVGGIAIRRQDRDDDVVGSVGYWVSAQARGQNLAGRALEVLAPWAAAHLGLAHQELVHDLENLASCKTALAAGFEIDTLLTGASRYRDGRPRDVERHRWYAPSRT